MINYIQDDRTYTNKQRRIYSRFKEIYRYLQRKKRLIADTIGWSK